MREGECKIALSFCDAMKNGWIGRCLPRLFPEVGMTDISFSFRTISITYDFLQLLLGDMLLGLSPRASSRNKKPTGGGSISPRGMPKEYSFTRSQDLLWPAPRLEHAAMVRAAETGIGRRRLGSSQFRTRFRVRIAPGSRPIRKLTTWNRKSSRE